MSNQNQINSEVKDPDEESDYSSSSKSDIIENEDCFPDENEIRNAIENNQQPYENNNTESQRHMKKHLLEFNLTDFANCNKDLKKILESDLQENEIITTISNLLNNDSCCTDYDLSTLKFQIEAYITKFKQEKLSMIQEESKEYGYSTIPPQFNQEELALLNQNDKDKEKDIILPMEILVEVDEIEKCDKVFKPQICDITDDINNNITTHDETTLNHNNKDPTVQKDNNDNICSNINITDNGIIKVNETITSSSKDNPVHQRLYNMRKPYKIDIVEIPVKTRKNKNVPDHTNQFFENLYKDLEKRNKSKKDNQAKQSIPSKISKIQIKQNISTNKYLYNKFTLSFNQAISSLQSSNVLLSNSLFTQENIIAIYQKVNLLVQNLQKQSHHINMVTDNNINSNSQTTACSSNKHDDIKKIQELFESIKTPNTNTATCGNLLTFTMSIINLSDYCNTLMKNNQGITQGIGYPSDTIITDQRKYCSFDSKGIMVISVNQSKLISKDYNFMYHNWKNSFHHHTREKYIPNQKGRSNSTSSSSISKKKHITSFSQENINRQINKFQQTKAIMAMKNKENSKKELEQCTFKPQLTRYKSKDELNLRSRYLLSSISTSKNKKSFLKSKDDLQYEKEIEEYTFKPKINKINVQQIKKLYSRVNTQELTYEDERHNKRMHNARIQRDIKMKETNLRENNIRTSKISLKKRNKSIENKKSNSTFTQMKNCKLEFINDDTLTNNMTINCKEKIKQPLVIIDIKLRDDKQKRITAFEGDSAEVLAHDFIVENGKHILQ